MENSRQARNLMFRNRLENVLQRLQNISHDEKSDEVSIPLYLHKNFLVRKVFIDRFKIAYNMTSFANKSVLDYGCGSGIFLESISSEIKKGFGVDLDIEIAKKVTTSEKISLTQIMNHDEINKFSEINVITSFDVLEHVAELDSLLTIFSKILSDDGEVIISGPTENAFYTFARKLARIGIQGNLRGSEEHVRNIFDIKNKMQEMGFLIQKDINLWSLFHVMSFKIKR